MSYATGLCLRYPKPLVHYRVLDTEGQYWAVNDRVESEDAASGAADRVRSTVPGGVATLGSIEVREVVVHA